MLPDSVVGLPYHGHLSTSHNAGGTLSIVTGALPAGVSLPATFGASGDDLSGTPAQPDSEPTYTFTVQGTGDQGQPLYQAYSINVNPNLRWPSCRQPADPPSARGSQAGVSQNFFLAAGRSPTPELSRGGFRPASPLRARRTRATPRPGSPERRPRPAPTP